MIIQTRKTSLTTFRVCGFLVLNWELVPEKINYIQI